MMRRRRLGPTVGGLLVLAAVVVAFGAGCAPPHARFTEVSCDPVQQRGRLQAMAFTSSFETRGFAGQQLIYHVGLIDSRLKPIPSRNRRFRNTMGNVAASKALPVYQSPWTFKDVSVSIPVEELEVRAEDLPALAEFGLSRADGTVLAREVAVLPLYHATTGARDRYVRKEPASRAPKPGRLPGEPSTPARASRADGGPSPPKDLFTLLAEAAERWLAEVESLTPAEQVWQWPRVAAAWWLRPWLADLPSAERPTPSSRPAGASAPDTAPHQPVAGPPDRPPIGEKKPSYTRYVVQKGDTLNGIARRLLNDETRWIDIFQMNRDRLSSPHRIREGMVLRIPRMVPEPEAEN